MAMDDDIDMILFHDPEIGLGLQRSGSSEHDILQVGGDHRPAPAVGKRGPGALLHQVLVILIHTHVGPVHDLNDLPVDISRQNALLFPFVLQRLGGSLQVGKSSLGLSPFVHGRFGNTESDLI